MTLEQLRKTSGLKAYKVAEMIGVSRIQLRNYETGKYKMKPVIREKLSEIYGVNIEKLSKLESLENDFEKQVKTLRGNNGKASTKTNF